MAFSKITGKSIDVSTESIAEFNSTGIDDNATSTAITIAANNSVAIPNLHGNTTTVGNLTVGGDFIVQGNNFTVDADSLRVEDSLIQLASNNETSDVIDIGFFGHYSNDGNTALHTGFFRDASDEQYYLFNGLEDANLDANNSVTTINRSGTGFTLASLNVGNLNANGIFTIGDRGSATEELTIFHENNVSYLISDSSAGGGSKGEFSFRTNDGGTAGERVRIDGNGNVGIGTSSPNLHGWVKAITLNTSTNAAYELGQSGTKYGAFALQGDGRVQMTNFTANPLTFQTNNTERMRIDAGGSVLIGKTTPTDLHNTWNHLIIGEKGAIISQNGAGGINGITLADNAYIDADTGNYAYQTADAASKITQTGGVITFANAGSGSAGAALTLTERLRIDSSGNVIVQDGGELRVVRSSQSNYTAIYTDTGDSTIINNSWANKKLVLNRDGNVGIGETSPSSILHISVADHTQGSDGRAIRIDNDTTGRFGVIGVDDLENMYLWNGTNNTTGNIQLYTGGGTGTERVRLNSAGHLAVSKKATVGGGVTATSPDAVFTVQDSGATVGQITAVFGADGNTNTLTNSTPKETRIGIPHYNTAEEPAALIYAESTSSINRIIIGGGSSRMNAATDIQFRTASNTTTQTGTECMRISSSGNVAIGDDDAQYKLDVSTSNLNSAIFRIGYNLRTWAGGELRMGQLNAVDAYSSYLQGYEPVGNSPVRAIALNPYGGNVGIGTTTPSNKLDVRGTVASEAQKTDHIALFNIAAGTYNVGNWYTFTNRSTIANYGYGDGFYIFRIYEDTYGAGGGNYFINYVTEPFYFSNTATNATKAMEFTISNIAMGHAANYFPTNSVGIRVVEQTGASGANHQFQWAPKGANLGIDQNAGKRIYIYLHRFG